MFRISWPTVEFWMELNGDEPGVVRELDDLDELAVRRFSGPEESMLREGLLIGPVELVAMPMPFVNDVTVVNLPSTGLLGKLTRILAQSHRAALVRHVPLGLHEVDHGVRRRWIKLAGMGPFQAEHIARKLDGHALQPETETKARHLVLPSKAGRRDLSLDTALAKPPGYDDPVEIPETVLA